MNLPPGSGTTFSTLTVPFGDLHIPFSQIPPQYTKPSDNIMTEIEDVIRESQVPGQIVWDLNDTQSNETVFIDVLPDELLVNMAGATVRRYAFEINYYMNIVPDSYKDNFLDTMNERMSNLKKQFFRYAVKRTNGTMYWFDGEVVGSFTDDDLLENEDFLPNLHVSRLTFECTMIEVL